MRILAALLMASTLGFGIPAAQTAQPKRPVAAGVDRLRVEVLKTYPHDRQAFTQGLVLHQGTYYESTGLVGQSSLRQVELATGRVITKVDVPPPYFAEGLALVGDRLIQLTWQHGKAFVYDRRSLAKQNELTYRGEGWGLCHDGTNLVMSDGSSNLTVRNASDFSVIRTVRVTMEGKPVDRLNELECVEGAVYANVWTTDQIVRIDPATGQVTARIDAPNLLSVMERHPDGVLNGIAYDPSDKTFLITGKLWPKLFRVKFVK